MVRRPPPDRGRTGLRLARTAAPEPETLSIEDLHLLEATPGQIAGEEPLSLNAEPSAPPPGRLLRLRVGGEPAMFDVGGPIRQATADDDTLFVEVEQPAVLLQEWGCGRYVAEPTTHWLRLGHDIAPRDSPTPVGDPAGEQGGPADSRPTRDDDGRAPARMVRLTWWCGHQLPLPPSSGGAPFGWFASIPCQVETWASASTAGALSPIGPAPDASQTQTLGAPGSDLMPEAEGDAAALVDLLTPDGTIAARWNLGPGSLTAMTPWREGVALVIRRGDHAPSEIVALRPGAESETLLAVDLDITAHCRPLVPRSPETDSYLRRVALHHPVPAWDDVSGGVSEVVGDWPDARLAWTFEHPSRPGLRLRRTFALFDEIGRIAPDLELAAGNLEGDLDTGRLPRAQAAEDGTLDI